MDNGEHRKRTDLEMYRLFLSYRTHNFEKKNIRLGRSYVEV